MRAYAETLECALARFAPEIEIKRIALAPVGRTSRWQRRLESLDLVRRTFAARRHIADVWHVLDGSRAYLAGLSCRVPVVITAHDAIPVLQARGRFKGAPKVGRAARLLWAANAYQLRRAARVACVSHSTRTDLELEMGVDSRCSVVVPLPLRSSIRAHLNQSTEHRVAGRILHVGNNGFYKNRRQVLAIFAVLDRNLASELVMIGPQPDQYMVAQVDQLGIADRVRWVVEANDAELANWYHSAELMLFPSLYEGFGWPVLEALAFGLPVLASNAGSLPEVAGHLPICFPLSDTREFVGAAERLLRDPLEWKAASRSGRERAAAFGEAEFAAQMWNVYAAAVADRLDSGEG